MLEGSNKHKSNDSNVEKNFAKRSSAASYKKFSNNHATSLDSSGNSQSLSSEQESYSMEENTENDHTEYCASSNDSGLGSFHSFSDKKHGLSIPQTKQTQIHASEMPEDHALFIVNESLKEIMLTDQCDSAKGDSLASNNNENLMSCERTVGFHRPSQQLKECSSQINCRDSSLVNSITSKQLYKNHSSFVSNMDPKNTERIESGYDSNQLNQDSVSVDDCDSAVCDLSIKTDCSKSLNSTIFQERQNQVNLKPECQQEFQHDSAFNDSSLIADSQDSATHMYVSKENLNVNTGVCDNTISVDDDLSLESHNAFEPQIPITHAQFESNNYLAQNIVVNMTPDSGYISQAHFGGSCPPSSMTDSSKLPEFPRPDVIDSGVSSDYCSKEYDNIQYCISSGNIESLPPYLQETYREVTCLYLPNEDGDTKLQLSIIDENQEKALAIINKAYHYKLLNHRNKLGQTALILATIVNMPVVVRRLIVGGVTIDTTDKKGNTALHYACKFGHVTCAKHLMTPTYMKEVHVNSYDIPFQIIPQNTETPNYEGYAPLHLASLQYMKSGLFDPLEIIQMISRGGGDINVQERKSGKTILHMAAENGNKELIHFIYSLPKVELNARTFGMCTPVELAFGRGHMYIVSQLQSYGVDMSVLYDSSESDCDDVEMSDASTG